MPSEKVAELEAEYKSIDGENKLLAAELRTLSAGQEYLVKPPKQTLTYRQNWLK